MSSRARRRDAVEHRAAILLAAEAVFAEHGLEVPLEEICRRAGVGRATLYRNFGNRVALVHALMVRNVDALEQLAHDVAEQPDGLLIFLREVHEQQVMTGGLVHLIRVNPELDQELARRFQASIGRLLESARRGGTVAEHIGVAEVQVLVAMMWGGLDGFDYAERRRLAEFTFEVCMKALAPPAAG